MMLRKLTLSPFLSGRIVPKSHAGVEQGRHHHTDRLEAFPSLSSPETQRGDAWLDGQTWHLRLGWRQRLHLWGAERRRARLQRLDDLWDAQHEQVWTPTASSYRDFLLQERSAALRLAIYQHLALS